MPCPTVPAVPTGAVVSLESYRLFARIVGEMREAQASYQAFPTIEGLDQLTDLEECVDAAVAVALGRVVPGKGDDEPAF
jgi:hypothetical protein